MMHSIALSLPVKNLEVSKAFFARLGFGFRPEESGPGSACLTAGANVRLLLVTEDRFRDLINGDASPAAGAGKVLITLPASSEHEVDDLVMRAILAGGRPWPVLDDRPVYSAGFQDPDGHLWQVACPLQPVSQVPAAKRSPVAA